MTATLTYTGRLIQTACYCSIAMAVPEDLYDWARRTGGNIYCPLGHSWVFTDPENARLKRELKVAQDRAAAAQAEADRAEASRRAWKGQTTRLRNRAAEGQCPYCGKFLVSLAVHVARVHPDEHPHDLEESESA